MSTDWINKTWYIIIKESYASVPKNKVCLTYFLEVHQELCQVKTNKRDFPGGPVARNTVCQCRELRFPSWTEISRASGQLIPCSPCSRACRPTTTEPIHRNYWSPHTLAPVAPQQEEPRQREAHTPHWRVAPTCCNWREPACSNKDPAQPKINKQRNKKKISIWLNPCFLPTERAKTEGTGEVSSLPLLGHD